MYQQECCWFSFPSKAMRKPIGVVRVMCPLGADFIDFVRRKFLLSRRWKNERVDGFQKAIHFALIWLPNWTRGGAALSRNGGLLKKFPSYRSFSCGNLFAFLLKGYGVPLPQLRDTKMPRGGQFQILHLSFMTKQSSLNLLFDFKRWRA